MVTVSAFQHEGTNPEQQESRKYNFLQESQTTKCYKLAFYAVWHDKSSKCDLKQSSWVKKSLELVGESWWDKLDSCFLYLKIYRCQVVMNFVESSYVYNVIGEIHEVTLSRKHRSIAPGLFVCLDKVLKRNPGFLLSSNNDVL